MEGLLSTGPTQSSLWSITPQFSRLQLLSGGGGTSTATKLDHLVKSFSYKPLKNLKNIISGIIEPTIIPPLNFFRGLNTFDSIALGHSWKKQILSLLTFLDKDFADKECKI